MYRLMARDSAIRHPEIFFVCFQTDEVQVVNWNKVWILDLDLVIKKNRDTVPRSGSRYSIQNYNQQATRNYVSKNRGVNGEFTVEDFVSVDESRDLAEGLFGTTSTMMSERNSKAK